MLIWKLAGRYNFVPAWPDTHWCGRAGAALGLAFLPAWFGGQGLFADFTADDMMNLHGYWSRGTWPLCNAIVTPYSSYYRPAGGLFYLPLYHLAGLHPLAYRAVCYGILYLNVGLLLLFARSLTGSGTAALLAAMLGAHHAGFIDFYYNTGTVYDLLCFCFYCTGLCVWVAGRREGGMTQGRFAAVAILFVMALNSKEMAVTFPMAVLLYERLRGPLPKAAALQLLPMAALTVPYVYFKAVSPASIFHNVGGYRMELTAARYWENSTAFLDLLFYQDRGWFTAAAAIWLYVAMAVAAWALRSRAMAWSVAFVLVSPLPVLFIPTRGLFAHYVPLIGWCLFFGAALERTVFRIPIPRVALFTIFYAGLCAVHGKFDPGSGAVSPAGQVVRQMRELNLPAGPPARVLFLEDRFNRDEWTPYFLVRLFYGSRDITVDRVKMMPGIPPCEDLARYDLLLRDDGKAVEAIRFDAVCAGS